MSSAKKIWLLLASERRRSALLLVALMGIGMVLETIGVGLIVPILTFMSQADPLGHYPYMATLFDYLGNPSHANTLVIVMIALVAIYLVKAVFLASLALRQAQFAFSVREELSHRLFTGYLRQPYAFHLQRNTAQLIHFAVNETAQFALGAMIPAMTLLSETLVLVGIGSLLLVIEPIGALLVMLMLAAAALVFHRLTRSRLLRWGEARQHHEGMRIQHLQQGLGGVKDVKLLGREADFIAQYATHNAGSAEAGANHIALQALPRLWFELLAVVALSGLVVAMVSQGKPVESLVPTLGLFAAAAFRLMPSLNRMVTALQNLRYAVPVINKLALEAELCEGLKPPERSGRLEFREAITLDDLSFIYPEATKPALHNIDLVIRRGSSIGFVGGSGAGKSTLVDVVLGLLLPAHGTVRVDGVDIQTNLRGWQDKIGYVPQSIYLTDDTLRSNVALGLAAAEIDDIAVWRALRAAQLEPFVRQLPEGLDTLVGERGIRLSGGQRQRIGIARALYHDPAVLVLDEATSSLDTATEKDVMQAVKAFHGDKTIVIVAHRLSTVEDCDVIVRLEEGRVVDEGSAAELLPTLRAT